MNENFSDSYEKSKNSLLFGKTFEIRMFYSKREITLIECTVIELLMA